MTHPAPTVADVERITAVADPRELAALLNQVDSTPDYPHGTGAQDWGRLPDRMHFIADLFRIYHTDARLFDPPYSPEQIA